MGFGACRRGYLGLLICVFSLLACLPACLPFVFMMCVLVCLFARLFMCCLFLFNAFHFFSPTLPKSEGESIVIGFRFASPTLPRFLQIVVEALSR